MFCAFASSRHGHPPHQAVDGVVVLGLVEGAWAWRPRSGSGRPPAGWATARAPGPAHRVTTPRGRSRRSPARRRACRSAAWRPPRSRPLLAPVADLPLLSGDRAAGDAGVGPGGMGPVGHVVGGVPGCPRRGGWPVSYWRVRILVTNDDGVHAPGLAALARALSDWVGPDGARAPPGRGRGAAGNNYSGASAAVGTVFEREPIALPASGSRPPRTCPPTGSTPRRRWP